MQVNKFISSLDQQGGLAPLNRFAAMIKFPNTKNKVFPGLEEVLYHCDTVPMPGRTIATSELRHYGPTRKLAREQTYGEISLGFILTNSHKVRNGFMQWMDFAVDPRSGDISYQSQYAGTVTVLMFPQESAGISAADATSGVQYLEAFPTVVDPVNLGWDQVNTVGKFNETFHYKRWEPVKGNAGYANVEETKEQTANEMETG